MQFNIDVRQAIERLRIHFDIHDDGRPTPRLDEAVNMMFEILERENPKCSILDFFEEYGDIDFYTGEASVDIVPFYKCPICDEDIGNVKISLPNYCPNCGQKIDKSEVD